jgi:hypothetical protein
MYIEGQKKEAVSLFTRTLISFAVITAVLLAFGAYFA